MEVIDIDAVMRTWAVNRYENSDGDVDDVVMDIDWSNVKFTTVQTDFPRESRRVVSDNDSPHQQIIFKSNYENMTAEVQEHTFLMERSTEATVRTTVTSGFSRMGAIGIKIEVPPEVSKVTGGFGSDILIGSEDENTVKHELTWGLNSTVKAQPRMRTVAELEIAETEYNCKFVSTVKVRGTLLVKIRDSGSGEFLKIMEGDVATILEDEIGAGPFSATNGLVEIKGRKVTWKVGGNLKFKFGISQDVKVWSEAL